MYKFLLIATVFLSAKVYAQQFSDVAISVVSRETLVSKVQAHPKFADQQLLAGGSGDTLDFNVISYWCVLNNNTGQTGRVLSLYPDYSIHLLSIHDTIFFKKILRWKYDSSGRDESTPVLSVIDTTWLLHYIGRHNSKYASSWTLHDFLKPPQSHGFFGYLCGGWMPHITDDAYALAKLVKANDTISLKNLASSFGAGERAFGTMGLLFLTFKGQTLSKQLLDLIAINQASEVRIDYCAGCIIGVQSLREALKTEHIKYAYEFFVENELL